MSIRNFKDHKKKTQDNQGSMEKIALPTANEVDMLCLVVSKIPESQPVPFEMWDGNCYKTFFDTVITDVAKEIERNPWDVFACFMAKMHGVEFK